MGLGPEVEAPFHAEDGSNGSQDMQKQLEGEHSEPRSVG